MVSFASYLNKSAPPLFLFFSYLMVIKMPERLKNLATANEQKIKELRRKLLKKAGITETVIQLITDAERNYLKARRAAEEEFKRRLAKAEEERRQQIRSALKISEHDKEFLRLHKEVYIKILGRHIYEIFINS